MKKENRKCHECRKSLPREQYAVDRNGSTYYTRKCGDCRANFGRINPKIETPKNRGHRGPIINEYFEAGFVVLVLPPSAGHII